MLETKIAARRAALRDAPVEAAGAVAIRPLKPAARFSFRMPEEAARQAGTVAGFALDRPMLTSAAAGERLSLRLGPNEWLFVGPEADAEAIAGEIEAALTGRFFSLTDVGHRNVGIAVSGPKAVAVLNAGCPLDLSDAAFPVGAASRTLLGKAEIVLVRDGPESWRVECWRSFATYVQGFLAEAARDFMPG
jgi:sarcosine oxidase subunit gamma